MYREMYNNIRFRGNIKIIDLQDKIDYNNWHFPKSINIPYDELINNYRNYLNKNDVYYIYCKSGKLSKSATAILSYLGYNVVMLEK